MITDQPKNFTVDSEVCINCGSCAKVCPTRVIKLNNNKNPYMVDQTGSDFWSTCWECHRCLAVCPEAAISICGKTPENSLSKKDMANKLQMQALIANRRSTRNFKKKGVDKEFIEELLRSVGNLPTGSNNQLVMFSVLDEKEQTKKFIKRLNEEFSAKIDKGELPEGYDVYRMKEIVSMYQNGEDPIFRKTPHLAIPHAKIGKGEWIFDTTIALTYLELLMNSAGLGTCIQSFPRSLLEICPDARKSLGIPDDHYFSCFLSFGYQSIKFHRGVQRQDVMNMIRVRL